MENQNLMNPNTSLEPNEVEWREIIANVLQMAKSKGATAAEVSTSVSSGFSVDVRMGDVETVEHNRDKGIGITVYFGQRKGSASTSDTRPEAIASTVEAASHIAKYTSEDEFAGLASPELMAYHYPELSLNHVWKLSVAQAIELAKECEQIGMACDKRITNSDGSNVSTYQQFYIYGNSHGFIGNYTSTQHQINCMLIAKEGSSMQRDYSYSVARDFQDLENVTTIGRKAAARTIRRLNAKRLSTRQAPVIFESEVAPGLLGSFIHAISGGNLYRKSSFLLDHLGKKVFPDFITLHEDPHVMKGLGSAPFDGDGVITSARDVVKNGVLEGYVLSSYSARKLGMKTTGNAGGIHNLYINTSDMNLEGLLKKMDTGFLVTELMGHGVNLVTGDYSRGASGFWVEKGVIQYPVEEVTIAGNLRDMFKNLVAVGNDVDLRRVIQTGSILLENMTIAGE
jgi:PmbA protein